MILVENRDFFIYTTLAFDAHVRGIRRNTVITFGVEKQNGVAT